MANTDFYGIEPDVLPAFVALGKTWFPLESAGEETIDSIGAMLNQLRELHDEAPLAFEIAVRFVEGNMEPSY